MGAKTCTQPRSEVAIQSVCAVGSHPRRNQAAGVAYSAPATCKQLTPQITAICDGARDQPAPKLQVSLQTAQSVNNNQTHKRTEFQSTYIGLCLPIAVLQCDPATQRSSNAHLGVAAQLRCDPHDHTGLDNTCAERHQQRDVGWYART